MLMRRDKAREINLNEYALLDATQQLALLKNLAYWMIDNGHLQISRAQVEAQFAQQLPFMPGVAETSTEKVRRLFVERIGLLQELSTDQIAFVHRTFQEYLAAQAAVDRDNIGVLIKQAHDDQWREVIILAAGQIRALKQADALIGGLIARGDRESTYQQQLHLLAATCVDSASAIQLTKSIQDLFR
jgi:predicted NACHT family NTPase